jgi:hypothetical protein
MSEQLSGRALDRAIAEKLGYTVSKVTWTAASDADPGWMYALHAPNGQQATFGSRNYDEAWDMPSNRAVAVAEFHADANQQLKLCAERGWYISYTGNTALVARDIGGGYNHTHRGDGATPQEAGARAIFDALEFLARMKARAE